MLVIWSEIKESGGYLRNSVRLSKGGMDYSIGMIVNILVMERVFIYFN